jgi:hypothetical protein
LVETSVGTPWRGEPVQVIEALSKTATDVLVGRSVPDRFNELTKAGFDAALGFGLINTSAVVGFARTHF